MSTETVEQKAQRLLDDQAIACCRHHDRVYHARVQGDHDIYDVCITGTGYTRCTCLWGRLRRNDGPVCSHVLALRLYRDMHP